MSWSSLLCSPYYHSIAYLSCLAYQIIYSLNFFLYMCQLLEIKVTINAWRDGKRRILSKLKESTNKLVKWMTCLTIHYIHSVQYIWEQGLPWKEYSLSLPNRLCLDYYQVFVVCGCVYNNPCSYLSYHQGKSSSIKLSNLSN